MCVTLRVPMPCLQAQNRAGEAYDSAKAKVDETSQTAQHRAGEAWDNTKGQAQVRK